MSNLRKNEDFICARNALVLFFLETQHKPKYKLTSITLGPFLGTRLVNHKKKKSIHCSFFGLSLTYTSSLQFVFSWTYFIYRPF